MFEQAFKNIDDVLWKDMGHTAGNANNVWEDYFILNQLTDGVFSFENHPTRGT